MQEVEQQGCGMRGEERQQHSSESCCWDPQPSAPEMGLAAGISSWKGWAGKNFSPAVALAIFLPS